MFSKIANKIKKYFTYQNNLRELSQLSNRELDDIGISRSELHHIAWRNANQ